MKKTTLFLALSIAMSPLGYLYANQTEQQTTEPSLYQRLGGYDAVTAVVNDLVPRLAEDKQLGRFWKFRGNDSIAREKQLVVDFIINKAGGNLYYRGRDMTLTHAGMRISESDWKLFMDYLNITLNKFKLADKERLDVISFMESTKADMVELP